MRNILENNRTIIVLLLLYFNSCTHYHRLLENLEDNNLIWIGVSYSNASAKSKIIVIKREKEYKISFLTPTYPGLIEDTTFTLSKEELRPYQLLLDSIFKEAIKPNSINCNYVSTTRIDIQRSNGLKSEKLKEITVYGCFDIDVFFEEILHRTPH
jgi:hypothetical protein